MGLFLHLEGIFMDGLVKGGDLLLNPVGILTQIRLQSAFWRRMIGDGSGSGFDHIAVVGEDAELCALGLLGKIVHHLHKRQVGRSALQRMVDMLLLVVVCRRMAMFRIGMIRAAERERYQKRRCEDMEELLFHRLCSIESEIGRAAIVFILLDPESWRPFLLSLVNSSLDRSAKTADL